VIFTKAANNNDVNATTPVQKQALDIGSSSLVEMPAVRPEERMTVRMTDSHGSIAPF
jgi:hypothetical protein